MGPAERAAFANGQEAMRPEIERLRAQVLHWKTMAEQQLVTLRRLEAELIDAKRP
jgi:hypothetical protein